MKGAKKRPNKVKQYKTNKKGELNMANHFIKLDIEGLYNTLQPIKANYEAVKKELKSNDYLMLYGALTLIAQNNAENLKDYYNQNLNDVINSASISDNELYLMDFEGYEINERYTIKSLFLTENNNVMMSVYDRKKDRFIDFVA